MAGQEKRGRLRGFCSEASERRRWFGCIDLEAEPGRLAERLGVGTEDKGKLRVSLPDLSLELLSRR